jgi:hypothetical protein
VTRHGQPGGPAPDVEALVALEAEINATYATGAVA